jgi:hypothetical protein
LYSPRGSVPTFTRACKLSTAEDNCLRLLIQHHQAVGTHLLCPPGIAATWPGTRASSPSHRNPHPPPKSCPQLLPARFGRDRGLSLTRTLN